VGQPPGSGCVLCQRPVPLNADLGNLRRDENRKPIHGCCCFRLTGK
jgi:hypothetical protein